VTSAASDRSAHRGAFTASARVAEIFERHGRMVYGICRAMLRDVPEAEDAVQQAFLSAHRALVGGAHVRDEAAWIATIARNECRARISAAMRAPLTLPEEDLAEIVDGTDDVERRMRARELGDALAQLPERQREAVILRYVCGLRYGEVAKALGLSRPATEALLFRARRAMRVRLRHATAAVLVIPLSVREELALALPGFEAHAGGGAATAGLVGGLLAKLASAPAAAKVATATVAISAVGAVGAVESDRPERDVRSEARLTAALPDEQVTAPRAGKGGHEVSGRSSEDRGGFDGSREDGRRSRQESRDRGDDSSRATSGRSESRPQGPEDENVEPEDERDRARATTSAGTIEIPANSSGHLGHQGRPSRDRSTASTRKSTRRSTRSRVTPTQGRAPSPSPSPIPARAPAPVRAPTTIRTTTETRSRAPLRVSESA
jgi:RNA polymerase sigma factor (sigma-70 family)